MNQHVKALRELATEFGVQDIAALILDDFRFAHWSASSKHYQHHYGKGGLACHTYEVAALSLENRNLIEGFGRPVPSEREVYLAALWHDSGKVDDYTEVAPDNWTGTPHKRTIHHISRSAILWSRAVDRFPAYRPIEESVLHAILAHHGQRAWGSPVAPKSRLAWLLHLCDCLSARMSDSDTLDVVEHYAT